MTFKEIVLDALDNEEMLSDWERDSQLNNVAAISAFSGKRLTDF